MRDHYVTFDPTESVARTHDLPCRYSRAQGYYVPIYQASRSRRRRMGRTLLWLILLAGASWVLTGCEVRCDGTKIGVGMSKAQVLEICGKPSGRNHDSHGTDQWCYHANWTCVYFSGDNVRNVQWSDS